MARSLAWNLARPLAHDNAGEPEHRERTTIHRFDPLYWTVDFPRPMMAAVVAEGHDALRVTLAFTGRDSLAGLIWESDDRWDHPLLAYATRRDYRRTQLSFRWRSSGVKPLDAVNGPTLTIEGRDEQGTPRSWYVRLWNHAEGSPEDAIITIDFDTLAGGFLLPQEADPVWAGDIDRLFLSLVPPDYDGSATPYAAMADAWVDLSGIRCSGSGAVLPIGDAMLPQHGQAIATAYDDAYNQTPQRLIRQVAALGYRWPLLHYVGMSHYPRLARSGEAWRASVTGGAICAPALAWHRALADAVAALGGRLILSLSYELFADYCPGDWMQRSADGAPALTGWVPPSTLLSPAKAEAMGYLQLVGAAFAGIAVEAGLPVDFQIGEPWWWVTGDRRLCAYDAAASAALGAASVPITDLAAPLTNAQRAMLDAAGAILAQSTAALSAAVRAAAGSAPVTMHLLLYLPTLLDPAMPEARRALMPAAWAAPAFDILQIEDYDWVTRGQPGLSAAGRAEAAQRLGYGEGATHYLAGFVLRTEDKAQWREVADAAATSRRAGDACTFIWALPQVARDGFVLTDSEEEEEAAVEPFADVAFPIAIGREADVETRFSTAIATAQSGHEQRSPEWDGARLSFDAGPGIRSEADVRTLVAFFRARRGPAVAFRFRDPFEHSSNDGTVAVAATDQWLGNGDGVRTDFALVKRYGGGPDAAVRRITRPDAASVTVATGGVVAAAGWALAEGGTIRFAVPPGAGVAVSAGYLFDVPVRFAEDVLSVSQATWLAGDMPSVPMIEVREG